MLHYESIILIYIIPNIKRYKATINVKCIRLSFGVRDFIFNVPICNRTTSKSKMDYPRPKTSCLKFRNGLSPSPNGPPPPIVPVVGKRGQDM
jgi:hypothetical protein